MVKAQMIIMEDYEKKDPLWWCKYYKGVLSHTCIRLRQVLAGDSDRTEELRGICNILIDNLAANGIGIIAELDSSNIWEGEGDGKEDE